MAELADALDSGSSARKGVEVQVLLAAPVGVVVTLLEVFTTAPIFYALFFISAYSNSTPCRMCIVTSMSGNFFKSGISIVPMQL